MHRADARDTHVRGKRRTSDGAYARSRQERREKGRLRDRAGAGALRRKLTEKRTAPQVKNRGAV